MKAPWKLYLVLLTALVACSRATLPTLYLRSTALNARTYDITSVEPELKKWFDKFEAASDGYYVETKSFIPPSNDYFFLFVENDTTKFVGLTYSHHNQTYDPIEADYDFATFLRIDSLLTEFWNKPEQIPMIAAVMDGGATEMIGKRNGFTHRVYSTNAHIQDLQFDSLANVLSEQLHMNSIIEHVRIHQGVTMTIDNSH